MIAILREWLLGRHAMGLSVSLLGILLFGVPAFDMWEDVRAMEWPLLLAFIENFVFILLSGGLIVGGIWLVRTDLEDERVRHIAVRTLLASIGIGLLLGLAVVMQLLVIDSVKPYILVLDGVILGTVASFGFSISSVRADQLRGEVSQTRVLNERLKRLYEGTNDLEAASTRAEAYAATESVLTDVFPESVFRVTVEAEVVVEHGAPATSVDQPATTIEVGEQGWIEFDGSLQQHERSTIELFATYLNTTLDRIEREERLQEERDILAFVNRTLRHDLVGDLSLVRARLNIIDRNDAIADDSDPEHLGVALSRIEEMNEYIDRMGTYLKSVLDDCHELTAMELEPLIKEHVASFRESHPQAELRCEQLPTVTVEADELLHRVIVNLLRNGLEHNESPTPRITVEGERDGDTVQVRVADNGSGIADSRREAVFEQGERGTESDGSGFGLYLVKDVVENYGGTVRISDNEPQGSVFELDLPIA